MTLNIYCYMSTTERDKCSLSSFLPLSCRDGADAFTRHLHNRLRSLGSEHGTSTASESSWLATHEASTAVSHQPRHSADSDSYFNNFNFTVFESPGSPEEEINESELQTLINNEDNLNPHCNKCSCDKYSSLLPNSSKVVYNNVTNNHESDSSDGPYYDTESDINEKLVNGSPEYSRLSPILQNTGDSSEHSETTIGALDAEYQPLETKDLDLTSNDSDDLDSISTLSIEIEKDVEIHIPAPNIEFTKYEAPDKVLQSSDDDEKEEPTPRVRRCSSLKTGKTPPGTPGQKKIVRFADALGLDLADVRTFLDEIPKIPLSAYNDLSDVDLNTSTCNNLLTDLQLSTTKKPERLLLPLFQQPGGLVEFLDTVRERNVCLENAVVSDPIDLSIKGTVRVRNLDFHKSVHIRYTLDLWKTYADLQASYVENSCDGFSDTFSFLLYAHTLSIGQRLEFAVRFHCKGCQYWDNNNGANYCFQCLPPTNTSFLSNRNSYDNWGAGFY